MKIKKMPSKKLLEDYLDGNSGNIKVYFDIKKGEFIRYEKRTINSNTSKK